MNSVVMALAFLSFCMSFSGSFITFVKANKALDLSIKDNVILRCFGEFLGYTSRILVGFFTDKLKKRMPFLIIGYAPVALIKLVILLVFLPIFPQHIKLILFIIADLIDISLNCARDIARDCYIADIAGNNNSMLSQMIYIRKSVSLLGTAMGMIVLSTYYYIYPVVTSYITLSALSMIVAIIGVIVLFTFIRENHQNLIDTSTTNINLYSMFSNNMWLGFLTIFFFAFTKNNQFTLFQVSGDIIMQYYPQYASYQIFISTCLLPISYYIFGSISTFILSRFTFITTCGIFILLASCVNYIHIFHLVNLSSLSLLMFLNILYGCYNNIFDNMMNTIILKIANKNNIYAKGTILATSNIIMGFANLILATILSYVKVNIFSFMKFNVINNILGLLLLIFLIYKYSFYKDN